MMKHDTNNPMASNEVGGSIIEFTPSLHSNPVYNIEDPPVDKRKKWSFSTLKTLLIKNKRSVLQFVFEALVMVAVFTLTAVYYSRQKIVTLVPASKCTSLCENDGGKCEYNTIFPLQDYYSGNFVTLAFYDSYFDTFMGYSTLYIYSSWVSTEVENPADFPDYYDNVYSGKKRLYPFNGNITDEYYSYNETAIYAPMQFNYDDKYYYFENLDGYMAKTPVLLDCIVDTSDGLLDPYLPMVNVFVPNGESPSVEIFASLDVHARSIAGECTAIINGVNLPIGQYSNGISNSDVAQCTTHTNAVAYIGTGLSYALTATALFKPLYYFYDLLGSIFA